MNRHDNHRWKVRASVCSKPSMVARKGSCHRQSTWLQRHQGCLHRTTDERSRNRLPIEQAYRETESGAAIARSTTEVLAVGTRCGGEYVVASWQTDIGQAVNSTLLAHSHRTHGCANADILTSETREHARVRTWADGTTRSPGAIAPICSGISTEDLAMNRLLAITYGAVCYAVFLIVFVYAMGFVAGLTPRSIDNAIAAPMAQAVIVDLLLLAAFALQHSVMARPAFKRWWTRIVPRTVERSTYVLFASLVLAQLMWQWRALPGAVWDVTWQPARLAIWMVYWLGWAIVLASTFMISHFELFGLRQVFAVWRRRPQVETGFRTTLFYRVVRHPLNFGFIVAFWAAPTMTAGRLLFAAVTTGWIVIAMYLEEHDQLAALGARFAAYRQSVPMIVPGLPMRSKIPQDSLRTPDV